MPEQLNKRIANFFTEMCFPELINDIPESMLKHMEFKFSRHCFASLLEYICEFSFEERLNPKFYTSIKDTVVIIAFNRA